MIISSFECRLSCHCCRPSGDFLPFESASTSQIKPPSIKSVPVGQMMSAAPTPTAVKTELSNVDLLGSFDGTPAMMPSSSNVVFHQAAYFPGSMATPGMTVMQQPPLGATATLNQDLFDPLPSSNVSSNNFDGTSLLVPTPPSSTGPSTASTAVTSNSSTSTTNAVSIIMLPCL